MLILTLYGDLYQNIVLSFYPGFLTLCSDSCDGTQLCPKLGIELSTTYRQKVWVRDGRDRMVEAGSHLGETGVAVKNKAKPTLTPHLHTTVLVSQGTCKPGVQQSQTQEPKADLQQETKTCDCLEEDRATVWQAAPASPSVFETCMLASTNGSRDSYLRDSSWQRICFRCAFANCACKLYRVGPGLGREVHRLEGLQLLGGTGRDPKTTTRASGWQLTSGTSKLHYARSQTSENCLIASGPPAQKATPQPWV